MELKKVTFKPYNQQYTEVVAEFLDNSEKTVYLDNLSTKIFLQQALSVGSMQPPL